MVSAGSDSVFSQAPEPPSPSRMTSCAVGLTVSVPPAGSAASDTVVE